MLPRLRFVVAAIAIALTPMIFLGSGLPTSAPDSYVSGYTQATRLPGADMRRDVQQQLTFAYARRNSEIERLRELTGEPLRTWVMAPAGEPSPSESETTATVEPAAPDPAQTDAAGGMLPLPQQEASLPPEVVAPDVVQAPEAPAAIDVAVAPADEQPAPVAKSPVAAKVKTAHRASRKAAPPRQRVKHARTAHVSASADRPYALSGIFGTKAPGGFRGLPDTQH